MRMSCIHRAILSLILVLLSTSSQADPLTVLAVKGALEESIQSMREALASTTHDIQSIGNSLQANAQNVILDIDRSLGSKLEYTFSRLDASELRLMEDAQALTEKMRLATNSILTNTGEEARKTIVEADIAAYNASYSLPCRDAKPRIVASFPARLIAGRDSPKMTLRGNFLKQGPEPIVTINNIESRILERLDTALSIEIPQSIIDSAPDGELFISAKVENLEELDRTPILWGVLGCWTSKKPVTAKPIALTILEQGIRYKISGSATIEYTSYREAPEPTQKFRNTGSSKCDDSYRVDKQWCILGPGTVVRADISVLGANCSSAFEGTTASGDRCILAQGKVAGCGANRGPFNTWLGCKGRGWLNYDITLIRKEPYQEMTDAALLSKEGKPFESSFSFDMPASLGYANPIPRYTVQVEKLKGKTLIESYSISHANPNAGPVTSRVSQGVISIEINN